MSPKISLIIPNYNKQQYLIDTFESVLAQTFKDWECIIIDDGSTDDSRKIINRFANRDSRFKTVFQKNSGVCAARNAGLRMATGTWVMFLDSDDCLPTNAMESLISTAERYNADLVGGGTVVITENSRFKPVPYTRNTEIIFKSNDNEVANDLCKFICLPEEYKWLWIWRHLFKREMIADKRFIEEIWYGDDVCWMLDIMHESKKFVVISAPVCYHRLSVNSVSQQKFNPEMFIWFPTAMQYIHDNLLDKYSKQFWKILYKGLMKHFFEYSVKKTMENPQYKQMAANEIKKVYGTPAFPKKYLSIFQRILLWLFIKGYSN